MDQEIDDEVIQLGTLSQQQAYHLVRQAISATTTHEKDKLIEEMRIAWRTHDGCAQQLRTWNISMAETLSKLEEKHSQKNNEYNTLLSNTSFVKELQRKSTLRSRSMASNSVENEKSEILAIISEIEKDILKLGPLKSASTNQQQQKNQTKRFDNESFNQMFDLLKLKDLTFKRLEELSYALKKRSFIVDESEDLSLAISEEFGSLNGLVQAHQNLLNENRQLKAEELSLINDSMVKRRNTSKISISWLSNIILALQSELSMQSTVGESLLVKPVTFPETKDMDFDSLGCTSCSSKDISFSRPEFATTISKEAISTIVDEAKSASEKLEALQNVIEEQKMTIQRLYDELEPLRDKRYGDNETFVTQEREQRLWALQDKFQQQVRELQEQICEIDSDSSGIYRNIITMIKQRKFYGQTQGEWFHKYKKLLDDDTYLIGLSLRNEEICQTLTSISDSLGLILMNDKKSQDSNSIHDSNTNSDIFYSYLRRIDQSENNSRAPSPPTNKNNDEEEENSENHKKKMQRNLQRKRNFIYSMARKQRKHNNGNNNTNSNSVSQDRFSVSESNSNEKLNQKSKRCINPIYNASKVQLFDFLALVTDIKSRIKGPETSFHANISGRLHFSLGELRSSFYQTLNQNFEIQMRNEIRNIQTCEEGILRIPKADIATEADTEPRTEDEAQTEEEVKGGKGAKVKPPPKEKTKASGRKIKK